MARNKHPEQTVQLILDTAVRLFTRKGYDRTTLQDIIDATGLSKGAIYHHFASKEAILIDAVDRIGERNCAVLAEVRDRKDLTGAEKLREMSRTSMRLSFQGDVMHMLPFLIDNPKFLALQIKSLFEEAAPDYVLPVVREGIADGSIRTDYPEELTEALLLLLNLWLLTLVQAQVPGQLLGKVIACIQAVANCASPLGQAAYGVLFDALPAWAVLLGAAGLSALVALRSRQVFRQLESA